MAAVTDEVEISAEEADTLVCMCGETVGAHSQAEFDQCVEEWEARALDNNETTDVDDDREVVRGV